MSWKLTTHLEFNDIQPVCFLFLPFHDMDTFPLMEPLSGHWWWSNWEGSSGNLLICLLDQMAWLSVRLVQVVGAQRKTTGDGEEGRLVWHS